MPPFNINMCLGQTLDLNTQFITNPIPNTPVWTDITSGTLELVFLIILHQSFQHTYILRATLVAT